MSFYVSGNRLLKLCSMCLLLFFVVSGCARKAEHSVGTIAADPATAGNVGEKSLPELSEDAALEDYLRYAALNNAGLQSAFNDWRAELERIPQVSSLPDPTFTYKHFIEEIETRVGPQRQSFGVSQMFPWFGKLRLRKEVAIAGANIAGRKYEMKKRKLFLAVKEAYYEYYYLGKAIIVVSENVALMKTLEEVVRSRYKTDDANYPDLIRLQVELGKLSDKLSSLKDMIRPRSARLNAILNRPVEARIPFPKALPNTTMETSDDEIRDLLRTNNPELEALKDGVKKAAHQVELSKKEGFPDIMIGLNYIATDDARMPNVSDSGKDPVVVMLSINLPVWRGKYNAKIREAGARYVERCKALEEMENKLSADLQLALYNYRDAERRINLYRDTLLPQAKQALGATQRAFAANKAGFLDMIDALKTILEFRLMYERFSTDREKSIAAIEMIVGSMALRLHDVPLPETDGNLFHTSDVKLDIK